jgi:hypothetical protein
MSFIFNNISHTQITIGFLRDYRIDFLNVNDYTGKQSTPASIEHHNITEGEIE